MSTYITFGVSSVENKFCVNISSQLRKGKLLIRGDFPYYITVVYRTNVDRRELFDIVRTYSYVSKCEGTTVSGIDLEHMQTMREFILRVVKEWPIMSVLVAHPANTTDSIVAPVSAQIEKVDMESVSAKEVVDLSSLCAGVNWILLDQKTKPEIVSFM